MTLHDPKPAQHALEDAAFHGMIPVSRRRLAVCTEEQSMEPEIIGMDDMLAVYEITDLFGIDRESISVPLEKRRTAPSVWTGRKSK